MGITSACGGASADGGVAGPPKDPPQPAASAMPPPKTRVGDLAQAKVFDASGKPEACAAPTASCPDAASDREFLVQCRLAGFQVRQCGCEARCTGNVVAARRHYDPSGQAMDCAPAKDDCTPPQASAAFQDACVEKGFRLDVCGCAWLCSGNFMK